MVRLRPVLLTAGTTILGLLPMAQGFDINIREMKFVTGTGSMEFWGPMAVAVIYGLLFATVLTLVVVPVMYHVVDSGRARWSAFFERHAWLRKATMAAAFVAISFLAFAMISGISALNG